jgi:cytochrome c556
MNKNLISIILFSVLVAVFGLTSAQEAKETPEMKAVDYRMDVMHVMAAQRNVLRDIVAGKREDNKEVFINAANALSAVAKTVPVAFTMNAIAGDSTAKPDIWKNWDDFVSKANNLSAKAASIAKTAATDMAAAKAMVETIEECGACHEVYRVED